MDQKICFELFGEKNVFRFQKKSMLIKLFIKKQPRGRNWTKNGKIYNWYILHQNFTRDSFTKQIICFFKT